jgi:hypothetical protein
MPYPNIENIPIWNNLKPSWCSSVPPAN